MTEQGPTSMEAFTEMLKQHLAELSDLANQRRGGAWTTGLCVVGVDMQTGLHEARRVVAGTGQSQDVDGYCSELAKRLRTAADNYPGHDAEGYVAGTIIDVAAFIEELIGLRSY